MARPSSQYFGEILMWGALALISSSAAFDGAPARLHAGWISPAFSALLLLKVSGVPLVERAGEKKWGKDPAYRKYMDSTPCVIPFLPLSLSTPPPAPAVDTDRDTKKSS